MTEFKILIVKQEDHGLLEHTYNSAKSCTDAINGIAFDLFEWGAQAYCVVVGL